MARAGTPKTGARMGVLVSVLLAIALAAGLIPAIPFGAGVAGAKEMAALTVGDAISYGSYSTHYMAIEGTIAYCGVPSASTPQSGTYEKEPVDMKAIRPDNVHAKEHLASSLWFGFGGPAFDRNMWPATWYDGSPMTDERYLALTHIIVADFYACDGAAALYGCSPEFRSWVGSRVLMVFEGSSFNPTSVQGQMYDRASEVPQGFADNCFQLRTGSNTQNVLGFKPGGWLQLTKASADPALTENNGCYSLEGAVYGVYADVACTNQVDTLKPDAAGPARTGYLSPGTYHVKEIQAPEGYALDETVYDAVVQSGRTTEVNGGRVVDQPQYGIPEMLVAKLDLETGTSQPQGGASLADARFKIRYYDGYFDSVQAAEKSGEPIRTWIVRTDAEGKARLDDAYRVKPTDGTPDHEFYHGPDGQAVIPLGTVLIQEVSAPKGYHLSDARVQIAQLKPNGTSPTAVTYHAPSVADQVFRGDLEFVKARESDQNRLAGVPFRIANNVTGESHVVVTDANGHAGTQASWNKHSMKTNANDAAVRTDGTIDETKLDATAGCWFGASAPDDSKGALPYGSYSIEELPVTANAGLALIRIPNVMVGEREGYTVDLGTFDNQSLSEVTILTFAREKRSGSKTAQADPATTIIDRVQYFNLDAASGVAYELRASLVDAADGSPIVDAGEMPVTGLARFTPTQPNGYAEVPLTLDTRSLAGHDVTVYEELVRCDTGAVVAEHKDASDHDQMVHVGGQLLKTTATDAADGNKEVSADPETTICDNVYYKGLVAGDEYQMEGSLWLVGENGTADALCDASGTPYTTSVPFVPDHADGHIDLSFTCNTSALDGRRIVVFETLYKDGELIAEHSDVADEAQTVTVRTPSIATVAADRADGDDTVSADDESAVVDTVDYEGLIPGKEYRLVGTLMTKSYRAETNGSTEVTAEPLEDGNGDPIQAQTTFTPQSSTGQTSVVFELDSSRLDDRDIVVYESLYRGETLVAEDNDPENTSQSFSIHATGIWTEIGGPTAAEKLVHADSEASVRDSVRYSDAVIDAEYTFYGMLVDSKTGIPLLQHSDKPAADETTEAEQLMRDLLEACGQVDAQDGRISLSELIAQPPERPFTFDENALAKVVKTHPAIADRLITAQCTCTAEETSGATDLTYRLDARDMEGTRATSIVLAAKDGHAVAVEVDLSSKEQTITFVTGTIKTAATDATDGDQQLLNSSSARIRDEVSYEGLVSGKEYLLEGILYDRSTAEPLLIADKEVSSSTSFVAAAESGSAHVEFSLDASSLAGREIVVYEYLYRNMETASGEAEKVLVAQHADIRAQEQTVSIAGSSPGLPATGYDKTGDVGTPLAVATIVSIITASAGVVCGIRQLRNRNRAAQRSMERALRRP